MKMILEPHKKGCRHQITTLALNLGLFAGLAALPLQAQDYEIIPEGYSEEEWYDPSGWFDGDNIEADYDNSSWWDNDGWLDSADSDSDSDYDYGYGYDYGYDNRTDYNNDSDYNNGSGSEYNNGSEYSNGSEYNDDPNYAPGIAYGSNVDSNFWTTDTGDQARNQRQDSRDRRNQGRSMGRASFNGEVEGFKKVNLKDREGKRDQHTFVRVRLDDGGSRVVSLGSRLILSDLDLEKGAQISVSGRNGRIDNRKVLVANSIEVDDQAFRINKNNRLNIGQPVSINGTVQEISRTSLRNDSREKNLLVLLELKNGRNCVVDLGRDTILRNLDIEKGSEIGLQGRKTKFDGKSLIIANTITLDGERTRLRNQSTANQSALRDREDSWQNNSNARTSAIGWSPSDD